MSFDLFFMLVVSLIVLVITVYALFDRWCDCQEEKARINAHIVEIRHCYGSEQSFLDLEDDDEHLESLNPDPIQVPLQKADQIFNLGDTQHGPSHHPGEWVHKIGLPTVTDEEKAAIEKEPAEEEEDGRRIAEAESIGIPDGD